MHINDGQTWINNVNCFSGYSRNLDNNDSVRVIYATGTCVNKFISICYNIFNDRYHKVRIYNYLLLNHHNYIKNYQFINY